jgi:hypothetical protein
MIRAAARRLHHEQAGGSLVEALVASALLGTALITMMGSFATFAIGGHEVRQVAIGQALVRADAAHIKAAPYQSSGDYSVYLEPVPAGLIRTVSVTWWDGVSSWVGSQNANGVEKLALSVSLGGGAVATLEVLKANR